jgi:hypothetical protein
MLQLGRCQLDVLLDAGLDPSSAVRGETSTAGSRPSENRPAVR